MQSTQFQVTHPVTHTVTSTVRNTATLDVTPAQTPAVTLRAAARYLVLHGWIQGAYYDPTATVFTPAACIVGAIGMVCFGGPVDAPAQHFDDPGFPDFEAALAYLDRFVSDAWLGATAYDFNDAKGRVAQEVIHLLNEAADAWDRKHSGGAQ